MTEAYHYEALRKARILQRKREGQMSGRPMSRDDGNWQSIESRGPQNDNYFPPVDRPYKSYHSWSFGRNSNYSRESLYQFRPASPREVEYDLKVQARTLRNHNLVHGHPSQFDDVRRSGSPRTGMQEILGRPHGSYCDYDY